MRNRDYRKHTGNAIATVQSSDNVKVITVRGTAFPAAGTQDAAAHEDAPATGDKNLSEFVSEHMQKSDRPELDSATRIISGGRGMKSGENFDMLYELADKIGAAGENSIYISYTAYLSKRDRHQALLINIAPVGFL